VKLTEIARHLTQTGELMGAAPASPADE
jgi:hypothetical protein